MQTLPTSSTLNLKKIVTRAVFDARADYTGTQSEFLCLYLIAPYRYTHLSGQLPRLKEMQKNK